MAQGDYGTSTNPLESIHGEQIVYEPLTADPPSSEREEGSRWFRSDLDSGDKIGTLRIQNDDAGNDIDDQPVFPEASTVNGVTKAKPVATANGEGFAPYIQEGGALDQLRLQHNGTWYGAHDSLSAIPDSAVSRWTFDDADTSGSTATDVWNGYDGTISGATTGVTGHINQAYSFDGTDDQVNFGTPSELVGVAEVSLSVWVNLDQTYSSTHTVFGSYASSLFQATINLTAGDWYFRVDDGTNSAAVQPSAQTTGAWVHLVLTYNAGELTGYVDATGTTATGGPSTTPSDLGTLYAAYAEHVGRYIAADIDDPRVYSKELTSTEVSNLYNTGSISG